MAPQREWFEKDYYAVLGVPSSASEKDVTKAYRKLAKQFHPDANAGDTKAEDRFKDVSAAYDVLGDAAKRKEYDEVRRMVSSGGGFGGGRPGGGRRGAGPMGGFDFDGVNVSGGGLGDVLGGLFGMGGRRGRGSGGAPFGAAAPIRGDDLETELHLELLDALTGITTTVSFTSDAACSVCGGSGAEPGTTPDVCPECAGTGAVDIDQGPFSFSQVCPRCGGRGAIVTTPCHQCGGQGVERRRRDVKVRIPRGVDDDQRIRVKGRGGAGANGGPPGDLYVRVHVPPHARFGRSGNSLTVRVPVTFVEATLGADVTVPTPDGTVTVKVPAGTQSGKTVKVRGRGAPGGDGADPGDLLVTFDLAVPTHLDAGERKAVEALGDAFTANPRQQLGV